MQACRFCKSWPDGTGIDASQLMPVPQRRLEECWFLERHKTAKPAVQDREVPRTLPVQQLEVCLAASTQALQAVSVAYRHEL